MALLKAKRGEVVHQIIDAQHVIEFYENSGWTIEGERKAATPAVEPPEVTGNDGGDPPPVVSVKPEDPAETPDGDKSEQDPARRGDRNRPR